MFIRKTVEQMVARMITWGRGTTKNLTDFRPGSKIRTLYESVALIIEDMYDYIYRTLKVLIEENIYAIFGFDKISSVNATGVVRFARSTIAERDYVIPSGTLVQSIETGARQSLNYRTTQDAVLLMGTTSVNVTVVCETSGELGNTGANTITLMPSAITGIETASNPYAFTNGSAEETKESQKSRFQRFIQANARAVLPSIEYGASLAQIISTEGIITERVVQAKAFEELPTRTGEVDVYLWNGVDGASQALLDEAHKHITGYYDASGNRVYGYKAAGIWLNMYVASRVSIKAEVDITTENWFEPSQARTLAEREIDLYFADLIMGQTIVQTAVESNIKNIGGVYDVKLRFSTDNGVTFDTENIMIDARAIGVIVKPINFRIRTNPRPTANLNNDNDDDDVWQAGDN